MATEELHLEVARQYLAKLEAQLQNPDRGRAKDTAQFVIQALATHCSPVQKLPVELLSRIFLYVVREELPIDRWLDSRHRWKLSFTYNIDTAGRWYHSTFSLALGLSHVCGFWRKVALETPRMWCVPLPLSSTIPDASALTTRTFFERSCPFPIPLRHVSDLPQATRKEVFSVLPRAEALALFSYDLLSDMEGDACPYLPNLRVLSIDMSDVDPPADVPQTPAFLAAPKLTSVRLEAIFLPMPWAQLEHLVLLDTAYDVDASTWFAAIAQCVSLVTLELKASIWERHEVPEKGVPKTLPRLQTVDFATQRGLIIHPFFSGLALPALHTFDICIGDEHDWTAETQAEVKRFLERAPRLTTLRIDQVNLTDEEIRGILLCTPALEDLTFINDIDIAFTDAILRWLTPVQDQTPLVPRLHSLHVSGLPRNLVTDAVMQALIESRWAGSLSAAGAESPGTVVAWKKVHLRYNYSAAVDLSRDPLGPEFRARVAQLKYLGLNIMIF